MKPLILALLALSVAAPAEAARWQSAEPSSLRFEGSAQGESFVGEFKRFVARIDFDPTDLAATRFEVDIDLGSADSQNAERDELLRDEAFFAVDTQPTARFVAVGARAEGDGFVSRGTLRLKEHDHAVDFSFRLVAEGESARLEGEALLDRTNFAVGSGEWEDPDMIAHRVTVSTTLTLVPRQDAP